MGGAKVRKVSSGVVARSTKFISSSSRRDATVRGRKKMRQVHREKPSELFSDDSDEDNLGADDAHDSESGNNFPSSVYGAQHVNAQGSKHSSDESGVNSDSNDDSQKRTAGKRPYVTAFGAVSSYFDCDLSHEERKRRKAALECTRSALDGINSWKELAMPEHKQVQSLVRRRWSAGGAGARDSLLTERSKLFPQDFHLLQRGHNLLFFGLGSKKRLLELLATAIRTFETDLLRKSNGGAKSATSGGLIDTGARAPSCALTIKGFSQGGDRGKLRDTFGKILTGYFGQAENSIPQQRALERMSEHIPTIMSAVIARRHLPAGSSRRFEGGVRGLDMVSPNAPVWDRDLLIVLHNIDGELLRSASAKEALAKLAGAPGIRLIASVDHAHAPTLWCHSQELRLRFARRVCNTLEPYLFETREKPVAFSKKFTSAAGASYVLKSLTQNHKDVLLVLANHQIHVDKFGMEATELYAQCSRDMIVSNFSQLSRLLVEFKDHKIVNTRKLGPGGRENLYIAWATPVIEQVLFGE